jgi:hypothetical protein
MPGASDDSHADPSEDFEAWARLSASMLRRTIVERARLVHQAGLARSWRDLDARCFDVLAEDVAAGRLERLDRYLALCEAALRERRASGEQVPSPLDEQFAPVPNPSAPTARRISESATPPLARDLPPAGLRPPAPKPNQSSTAVFRQELRGALAVGQEAASWPLEQYARFCAELEVDPGQRDAIWAAHGIGSAVAAEAVHGVWQSQFDDDAELESRHRELVAQFLAALRRGDRTLAPR